MNRCGRFAWLLGALIAVRVLLVLRDACVTKTPTMVQDVSDDYEKTGNTITAPTQMTDKLMPSNITARLANQFQVCGQCPGETMQMGQLAVCVDVLQSAAHVLYYGVSAWREVGIGLHKVDLDRSKGGMGKAPSSTILDCSADVTGLPASVQFKQVCLTYEHRVRFQVPPHSNTIGVLNLESFDWRLLYALNDDNMLKKCPMLIIKFHSLEIQSKHLLYLQILEKLLARFQLISAEGAACDTWGVPGESFLMPKVLWATFLRKDLVRAPIASCNATIPTQRCTDGTGKVKTFSANFALIPGERVGEPEDLFFEIFAPYYGEDPRYANHLLPYKAVSMDFLRTFRLCHTCQSGPLLRVGPKRDGGYLVCRQSAVSSSVAISIGIRGDDPFGSDLSERFGIRVEGFDCTGEAYRCPAELKRCNFTFHNQCIGKPFGGKPPEQFTTISEVLDRYTKRDEEPILKIDCEGCEWNVLPEIPVEILQRFPMLIMEAHWLEKQERHPQYLETMRHLLQVFELVHSHACNCYGVWTVNGTDFGMPRIVELTFVRKDQASAIACVNSTYQVGLDFKICANRVELGAASLRLPSK